MLDVLDREKQLKKMPSTLPIWIGSTGYERQVPVSGVGGPRSAAHESDQCSVSYSELRDFLETFPEPR